MLKKRRPITHQRATLQRPHQIQHFQAPHFTLVKEALIEIGCVVTSLVVGWLVVTRVHCGQTVHPRPIVTMEH